MQLCPECSIELISDHKKIGGRSNWMICPVCRCREIPQDDFFDTEKVGRFIDRIRKNNRNENQFNKE